MNIECGCFAAVRHVEGNGKPRLNLKIETLAPLLRPKPFGQFSYFGLGLLLEIGNDGVSDHGGDANQFRKRLPPRRARIPARLRFIIGWRGGRNIRDERGLFWGTATSLSVSSCWAGELGFIQRVSSSFSFANACDIPAPLSGFDMNCVRVRIFQESDRIADSD